MIYEPFGSKEGIRWKLNFGLYLAFLDEVFRGGGPEEGHLITKNIYQKKREDSFKLFLSLSNKFCLYIIEPIIASVQELRKICW